MKSKVTKSQKRAESRVNTLRMQVSALERRCEELYEQREKFRRALYEAIGVIEGLAEQQAMPDPWYEERLARFKELDGSKVN